MGLIKCIQEKTDYDTRSKLNVAYGWLEEEREIGEKIYTTSDVFELISTILGESS